MKEDKMKEMERVQRDLYNEEHTKDILLSEKKDYHERNVKLKADN